jgi:hypothetical protein
VIRSSHRQTAYASGSGESLDHLDQESRLMTIP